MDAQKLKELKKKIFESLEDIQNQIVSSHSFNLLKERYESLSIFHQKTIKYSLSAFGIILICFLPLYYYFVSLNYWGDFKERYHLSIKLLKTRSHQSNQLGISKSGFKKILKDTVEKYQDKAYSIKDKAAPSKNSRFKKVNYEIQVEHLNIRQVMKMGVDFQHLPIATLSSLILKENKKYPKHYDTVFTVSGYFTKKPIASLSRERKRPVQLKGKLKKPKNLKKPEKRKKSP